MKNYRNALVGFASLASLVGCAPHREIAPVLDTGSPMQEVVSSKTELYEGYPVELITYQSRVRFPDANGTPMSKRRYVLAVRDIAPDGTIVAELSASTRFGTERPFLIHPQTHIPREHPFKDYTANTLEEIYRRMTRDER